MPVSALIIRALLQCCMHCGDDLTVECPTGSGRRMSLYQVAEELTRRLASNFLRDKDGRRPVHGTAGKFQEDPHWRDCLLSCKYFHGDNGAGLGASHRTGWTGVIARAMHLFAALTPEASRRLSWSASTPPRPRGDEPLSTPGRGCQAADRGWLDPVLPIAVVLSREARPYLPMQNVAKMRSSTSSALTRPVTRPIALAARRSSSARSASSAPVARRNRSRAWTASPSASR